MWRCLDQTILPSSWRKTRTILSFKRTPQKSQRAAFSTGANEDWKGRKNDAKSQQQA